MGTEGSARETRQHRRVVRGARSGYWLGVAGGLWGLAVLLGWTFDIELLKSPLEGESSMKPNSALGLLLAGLSVALLASGEPWCKPGFVLGGMVGVLGVSTFLEDALHLDFGIDQFLFRDDPTPLATGRSGRMSPMTSCCLALSGGATLLLFRSERLLYWAQSIAVTIVLMAVTAVFGYLEEAPKLLRVGPGTTAIAAHTACGLILIGGSILLVDARAGIAKLVASQDLPGAQLRLLLPSILLLPILLRLVSLEIQKEGLLEPRATRALIETGSMLILAVIVTVLSVRMHRVDEQRIQALEQARVRELALDATTSAVTIADAQDPEVPLIYVNPAFEQLTGYSRNEILGRNCRFLNAQARDQDGLVTLRRAIEEGEECQVVLLNHKKDGTRFWNELAVSPVRDRGGRVISFVGVQEDVTERIEAAAARERILQDVVTDKAKAEEATRTRDVLLAVVSHELRSPLNAAKLWASLLLSTEDPDVVTVRRAAEQIVRSVDVQARLIDDLLDVSRIANGRLELEKELIDLADVVGPVLDELEPACKSQDLTLRYRPCEGAFVTADTGRVEQVLRNLVGNAIKFTPSGGSIEVALESSEQLVAIRVQDSGRGLEKEQLQQVFQRFWQAQSSDGSSRKGVGLGLYIAHQIAARHGGMIRAHSDGPGLGSTFTLALPKASVATEATMAPGHGTEPAAHSMARDILIVDDEEEIREVLALSLRARGFAVEVAVNGLEALERVRMRRPAFIVSDISMPRLDGLRMMRHLRGLEVDSDLPPLHAVAISGRGFAEDRRVARQAGFDAYLAKPLDVESLLRTLTALGHRKETKVTPRRILMVESDVALAATLKKLLESEGHGVQVVHSAAAAIVEADRMPPEVLITSLELPDGDGESLAVGLSDNQFSLFAIGITDSHIDGVDRRALDAVLKKPLDLNDLRRALKRVRRV